VQKDLDSVVKVGGCGWGGLRKGQYQKSVKLAGQEHHESTQERQSNGTDDQVEGDQHEDLTRGPRNGKAGGGEKKRSGLERRAQSRNGEIHLRICPSF